jgi:hypothetical protein
MRSTGVMRLMGIGRRQISLGVRLAARVAGRRVLGLELALVVAPELERGLVAAEPEHGQGEAVLELGLAAAELVLVPVEAVLGRVPVEAVLEHGRVEVEAVLVPGHPRAPLVLPLGTKSVTAPHRRGLPLLAAEDLAAAAETTREPAAAEAVVAWAAVE